LLPIVQQILLLFNGLDVKDILLPSGLLLLVSMLLNILVTLFVENSTMVGQIEMGISQIKFFIGLSFQ
jgi:hypothetical protein